MLNNPPEDNTITARRLITRLCTAAREAGVETETLPLRASIGDQSFPLTMDNFQVDDDGSLVIALPVPFGQSANHLRAEQAFESDLRILQVLDLASLFATDVFEGSLDGALADFVDVLLSANCSTHPTLDGLTSIFRGLDVGDEQAWLCACACANKASRTGFNGVAVQLGNPNRRYILPDTYVSGWGYFATCWVYAQTLEEAWQHGLLWAANNDATARRLAGFVEGQSS